jgi:hypothetical protein
MPISQRLGELNKWSLIQIEVKIHKVLNFVNTVVSAIGAVSIDYYITCLHRPDLFSSLELP